jgi:hypothetical protein
VSGFASSNVANILILMMLDDFCLLPVWFSYVIINVRYLKSLVKLWVHFLHRDEKGNMTQEVDKTFN